MLEEPPKNQETNTRIADVGEAHNEAKVEAAGRSAADRVEKGLFMSAKKHAQLQDEAYRRAADFERSNQRWDEAMKPKDDEEWTPTDGYR